MDFYVNRLYSHFNLFFFHKNRIAFGQNTQNPFNLLIQIKNITKSFGQKKVLDHISGTVKQGALISLVGMSGSGKTTLLKIIAGLIESDTGSIYLNNKKLQGPKEQLIAGHEEIKLVFQDYALKPNMSVEENLNYALLGYGEIYKKNRVEQLIEICGLESLRPQHPQELSGGQKQRVAFARALANEPEVILMDEPFSNLDPLTKQSLLIETKSLAKKTDTTVILVTHDTRDAMEIADEIWVLQKGTIAQKGKPHEVYQHPKSPQIARLFGIINLLSESQSHELLNVNYSTGIWIENVKITPKGMIKGYVKEVIFNGGNHKLLISIHQDLELMAFDDIKAYRTGDSIQLTLDPKEIIIFE
ncbi:ABC transporter ATP-binding protein [Cyclobacteriaceae bacterium]|jgi:ABC-type Fe3+/spermidine/putrescine transport system ATPase subunit|nr:ABC transporter ATP-binding protein [Cyclobacteriaceae bacterium]|tara:strand:- start:838 stop:1914 length:1077 start_codon:yes stop_codon:yes gene_type:complete